MTKYIDSDRLRAEIKERLHCNGSFDECGDTAWDYDQGMVAAYNYVLSFLDSLQQEQDLIIINKKGWEAQEQFRKNKDFGKPLQHEQQEVDLDADIEMEWDSFNKHLAKYGEESEDVVWLNWYNFNELAHHFYELGLSARKEK